MIIVVDIGNTNIKLATYSRSTIKTWKMSTDKSRTADEYFALFNTLATYDGVDLRESSSAVISSVVPSMNLAMAEMFEKSLGIVPTFITSKHAMLSGIKTRLAQSTIGTDRLADLVEARALWPEKDLLVVGMGTATVFNLLDQTGTLYGQLIAPGIPCMLKGMRSCTAMLPEIHLHKCTELICDSTVASIESGIYWGYRSMVEGMICQIRRESGKDLYVVATGGGVHLCSDCDHINTTDSLLTIKGILRIYEKIENLQTYTVARV